MEGRALRGAVEACCVCGTGCDVGFYHRDVGFFFSNHEFHLVVDIVKPEDGDARALNCAEAQGQGCGQD